MNDADLNEIQEYIENEFIAKFPKRNDSLAEEYEILVTKEPEDEYLEYEKVAAEHSVDIECVREFYYYGIFSIKIYSPILTYINLIIKGYSPVSYFTKAANGYHLLPEEILTPGDMFDYIVEYDDSAKLVSQMLGLTGYVYGALVESIEKKDKGLFLEIVKEHQIDLSIINKYICLKNYNISDAYIDSSSVLIKAQDNAGGEPFMFEYIRNMRSYIQKFMGVSSAIGINLSDIVIEYNKLCAIIECGGTESIFIAFSKRFFQLLIDSYKQMLFYCWDNPMIFSYKAVTYLEKLCNVSPFDTMYSEIREEYRNNKIKLLMSESEDAIAVHTTSLIEAVGLDKSIDDNSTPKFKLPTDFFKSESVNMANTYIKSYANLNPDIRMGGVEKLEEFINYLASTSCIEDSQEAKESFVFKFTGRKVSESTNTDNHQIKWGRKHKDLVYLVQKILLIANPKNKYESLNEHFIFEDNEPMPNAAANLAPNAHKGFIAGVKSIYPEVVKK